MKRCYIINNKVSFYPDENRLEPLTEQGMSLTLNIPVSRCLSLLLQRSGEVVRQNEFISEVWENNGQYANANTYFQNIYLLRKSLKISGIDETVVITVPKEGLRFSGDVKLLDNFDDNNILNASESEEASVIETSQVLTGVITEDKIKTTPFFSVQHKNYINYVIIISSLIVFTLTSLRFYDDIQINTDFFSDYRLLGKINKCQLYANGKETLRQHEDYLNFIHEKKFECQPEQIAYISMNISGTRVLIHLCDKSVNNTASCLTRLYIVEKKDE